MSQLAEREGERLPAALRKAANWYWVLEKIQRGTLADIPAFAGIDLGAAGLHAFLQLGQHGPLQDVESGAVE
jgi:hypothetical protein